MVPSSGESTAMMTIADGGRDGEPAGRLPSFITPPQATLE